MPFEHEHWYPCKVTALEYIKSEKKATPAFQLTCNNADNGDIVGQWWMTDTPVKDPRDKNKMVPGWEAVMVRCKMLGCDDTALRQPGWVEHARENIVGKDVAVCVEINKYGDVKANFIGIPKGEKKAFAVIDSAGPSPFARQPSRVAADPFAVADDDVPF